MKISIVVAVSENNAIGVNGSLLWHLPKDMQYFKEVTMGRHVLMGRKTYESIPERFRPLPGRVNLVVSRNPQIRYDGCVMVSSLLKGIEYARENGEYELMIIGGGEIYRQAFDIADKIYLTKVKHTFNEADTFFSVIKEDEWLMTYCEEHKADERHAYPFSFTVLERIR